MNTNTRSALASIIVPCWNQLEFSRNCVAALKRCTRQPWELILVDNGSTDGTKDYCAGVEDAGFVPVTVVSNATNRGFPAAINQGLHLARGEYLVMLNNDVVVTAGWLDQLIALVNTELPPAAGNEDLVEGMRQTETQFTAASAERKPEGETPTNAESAAHDERETAGDTGNLTIIDFNEVRAGIAQPSMQGPRAQPPLVQPPQAREDILSPGDESESRCAATGERGPGGERGNRGIGLAGPMSNYAAPPQLVEGVPYHDLHGMHEFARQWGNAHRDKWFTVPRLSGFCLLMKRAVYETIGGLDERFRIGFFDDDDLAERARGAGFLLAVAQDLFVHHFGSRTFAGNGIDAEALLEENASRFAAKWGLPQVRGTRIALRPFVPAIQQVGQPRRAEVNGYPHPEGLAPPLKLSCLNDEHLETDTGPRARVSLVMIVRNEQENLPRCLESVSGLGDEIIVVDTGSTDRTIEIARSFGARVFDFPWVGDFAAARNAALARATGDYAFSLDADDVVDPQERTKLGALFRRLRPSQWSIAAAVPPPSQSPFAAPAAFVLRCKCDPSPDGTGGETVVDHIRLFPVREDIRWTYRVHEQILPALRRADITIVWTEIEVRHTGYVDKGLRGRKLERDYKILIDEVRDHPDDPFILFNLGSIAVERSNWPDALAFLQRSLARSAPTDSITRKLYALISRAHQMTGDTGAAIRTCEDGLALDREDAELLFRKGVIHRHRGESAEAEACWRRILTLRRPEKFSSVDQGIYGHLTRRNLAALAAERGDHAEARRLWAEVLAECPSDPEATRILGS
jgi:glycosyltransferase involved in cell wall biosynthesis